jgi:hypothetical protein
MVGQLLVTEPMPFDECVHERDRLSFPHVSIHVFLGLSFYDVARTRRRLEGQPGCWVATLRAPLGHE